MRRLRGSVASGSDTGQSTVELALGLPLVCALICGLVQIAVIVRAELVVQLAAREAARAAALADDPREAADTAAARVTSLRPLGIDVAEADGTVTARVHFVEHTDIPLIGALLPDVHIVATVTMATEPP